MKKEISSKKWVKKTLGLFAVIVCLIVLSVVVIDPFFHYHGPLNGLSYPYNDGRYQNDGIARHYSYHGIVAGSSVTQNFMTSEIEKLWGTETIKQTVSGATFFETNESLKRAFKYNDNIDVIIRCLEMGRINSPRDYLDYEGIPTYLYDDNIFNDVQYIFNKDVLTKVLAVINYTRAGNETPSMDEYESWYQYASYGREEVLAGLIDYSGYTEEIYLSDEDKAQIEDNIRTNMLSIALEHPDTDFYIFIPPYSAAYWYGIYMTHELDASIEIEKQACEILFEAPNIHVFDFSGITNITGNLDNYTDTIHYGEWINSMMLEWMHDGEYEVTKENYKEHFEEISRIYHNFEYDYQ